MTGYELALAARRAEIIKAALVSVAMRSRMQSDRHAANRILHSATRRRGCDRSITVPITFRTIHYVPPAPAASCGFSSELIRSDSRHYSRLEPAQSN